MTTGQWFPGRFAKTNRSRLQGGSFGIIQTPTRSRGSRLGRSTEYTVCKLQSNPPKSIESATEARRHGKQLVVAIDLESGPRNTGCLRWGFRKKFQYGPSRLKMRAVVPGPLRATANQPAPIAPAVSFSWPGRTRLGLFIINLAQGVMLAPRDLQRHGSPCLLTERAFDPSWPTVS
ncbi:predicted protein [Uncinocarpus reesii 1704]|uniref:Uncharacterized protein n=1 Tax=Uncinocarpus reesii (strain UAMH 1704) TaxID=336963 RepID=C4JLG2_UNCRE|nr:uncharacterized protein UREG_03670 [Uncinocarpus reesii 1704]EEP78824.1 predicted protein [Uncinocarpus reesii 1704]